PSAGLFSRFRALAAPNVNRVKITSIKAMAIRNIAGNCLIRIDTDSGLTGYGEAGATGPMARARIETMKNLLIGKDPLTIAVHCHNELDSPSAIAVAKAVEPMNPLFMEDALNPPFSEAWMALRRSTRVPLLTGEKLEMLRGFKPFVDNQAVDIIHPDLAFA